MKETVIARAVWSVYGRIYTPLEAAWHWEMVREGFYLVPKLRLPEPLRV